jgi:Zn-dependent M28 family amino/carboxypeptidase
VIVPSGNNPQGGASGGTIYADTNYTFGWFVYQKAHAMPPPLVIVAIEHYGRMQRLLERHVRVTLALNVDTEFTGDHEEGANLFADIPAVDPRHNDEMVIVGAHLDSWAAGTGATDNGAGVVIAMEAMRILKAIGIKPKRAIRLALWTGEEQGMLGSRAYVKRHIATIPTADTPEQLRIPEFLRRTIGPIAPKADHSRISAVYNIDAGGGKIRAVATGSAALVPVFQPWIEPLGDLGVTAVSVRPYCAGDCVSFERVGIPTPGFIQDPLDYHTRTHHTNMDTYEHLIPEDLRQAAVVAATMLYNTVMREEMLPRTALVR